MTCDELLPDYVLFAMGVLEDPERNELQAHLERGCEVCTPGVSEARALAYTLGASAEGREPSKGLRKRILAAAGAATERRWHWPTAWQTVAAMVLLGIGLTAYLARNHAAETEALRAEIARRGTETASLREALSLLQDPETREVTFGEGKPAPPRGRVFINPSSGVLLVASNLPAPPAGKIYEMWIIPKGGKPAPAGLFASSEDGTALHLHRTTISLATTGAIAVTLERAGGVDAPTSQPVIVAAL